MRHGRAGRDPPRAGRDSTSRSFEDRRRLSLPTYPFESVHYWLEHWLEPQEAVTVLNPLVARGGTYADLWHIQSGELVAAEAT